MMKFTKLAGKRLLQKYHNIGRHHEPPDKCEYTNPNKAKGNEDHSQRPPARQVNVETNTVACETQKHSYHVGLKKRSEGTQTGSGFKLNMVKKSSAKAQTKYRCDHAATQVYLCGHRPMADASCGYSFLPRASPASLSCEDQYTGIKLKKCGRQHCGVFLPSIKPC